MIAVTKDGRRVNRGNGIVAEPIAEYESAAIWCLTDMRKKDSSNKPRLGTAGVHADTSPSSP